MKKIISVMLTLVMMLSIVTIVQAEENRQTLKVGVSAIFDDYYPYEYYENNELVGFDIDLINEIAKRAGYNVEFEDVGYFDLLLYGLANNEVDCCISGIVRTKERMISNRVDYSVPYIIANTEWIEDGTTLTSTDSYSIVTRKNSNLKKIIDNCILDCINDGTIGNLAKKYGIDIQLEKLKNKVNSLIPNNNRAVKDVFFVTGNDFLVLMENGNLYLEDSIDTQTPNLIEKNIKNIVVTTDNLNHAKRIQMLCNNGDIKVAKINTSYGVSNKYEYEGVIVNNAKEILNTDESYTCLYISKSDKLQKYNGLNGETIKIMDNVRSCPVPRKNYLMAITNDDILYSLEYNAADSNYIPTQIMTDVKDATINLILRNNYDLYQYRDVTTRNPYDIPVRIGTNVGLGSDVDWFDNVFIDDFSESISYMTPEMDCYRYSQDGTTKMIDIYATNVHYPENEDFWRFAGNTDKFYLDFSGDLHINNKKSSDKIYLANVKKVIAQGNLAFFITNNGELYAENKESVTSDFNSPFLTVFGQKTTKIYMNNKEVVLKAKLQTLNDRTMYPFRECLEELGATVMWDDVNKIAIGEYGNTTIEFPIGSNKYYINGVEYEMDTISYIDNSIGRTYIPIRYAAEGLGFIVDWIPGDIEDTISIHK